MTNARMADLEELIDSHGLASVLNELAMICCEKAEHVRSIWQDEPLAAGWDKSSDLLISLAIRLKGAR